MSIFRRSNIRNIALMAGLVYAGCELTNLSRVNYTDKFDLFSVGDKNIELRQTAENLENMGYVSFTPIANSSRNYLVSNYKDLIK